MYEFGGGKVTEHLGGIYEFLSKKKMESLQQLEVSAKPQSAETAEKPEISENKLSYLEQKEQNRQIRKLERQIEESENKITQKEEKLSAMEQELSTPEGAKNVDLLQKYLEAKNKLDREMNNWERLTLELEKFKV